MAKVSLRAYNRDIEAMIDRSHLDEAIAHCQHILKTFPKHLETYRLLGKAYLEARRHTEAVDIFSRVLVSEPSDFVAQVGMSIIRDEQSKLDDAIWHMERAFESQPSNAAIQGELQRLYGRRDGVQPPRIRMTRGALANMYMQGELYAQAISEARGVLNEDQGRTDMQVLLAKAYFKSGQKSNAAEAASSVLKRYPYCLDANRILTDILSADKAESAQTYRKRVVELDPYAAHVRSSLFQAGDVNDAAVMIDSMDWNGKAVASSGWGGADAIGLGAAAAQPDWLKNSLSEPALTSTNQSVSPFADTGSLVSASPKPQDDIPDFLKSAGWGESTGAFDESKSIFEDAPPEIAETVSEGDLPDWVKAMKPPEQQATAAQDDEELPDWINKIGTGALPVPSIASFGDVPSSVKESDDQPDWLKGFAAEETGSDDALAAAPDWMKQFGDESASKDMEASFDFLNQPSNETSPSMPIGNVDTLGTSAQEVDDALAWFESLAAKQGATEGLLTKPEDRLDEEPDWVKQAKGQQVQAPPPVQSVASAANVEDLGKSAQEVDDALAWFESLAAKQGATEGLLTKPEDRLDEEPDWVKQAKGGQAQTPPPVEQQQPVQPVAPAANVEDLGKSAQEVDDALAWFESLAAKQGATEGLLTKPEERLDQEPDWVRQAKQAGETPKAAPAPEPILPDQSDEEPDWMKHARAVGEQFFDDTMSFAEEDAPVSTSTAPEIAPEVDDVASWLSNLDNEEENKTAAPAAMDETASWLNTLDEPESAITSPVNDSVPAWMRDDFSQDQTPVEAEPDALEDEAVVPSDTIPSWLSGLDVEEPVAKPASDKLPAWMRDDTGEVVAEPTKIEPTRSSDWAPVDVNKSEPVPPPPAPKKPAPQKAEAKPKPVVPATREPATRRIPASESAPVDPALNAARAELSRSNIPGALDAYEKLIKKGRFLEDTIYDLREALYRYPVEVSIWQTLGDAYMRANQLQDALDAYTKAEELLR